MGIIKKVVALAAIVACCLAVARPVAAGAAEGCLSNDHSVLRKTYLRTETEVISTHSFLTEPDENGISRWFTCNEVAIRRYYWVTCLCGKYAVGEVYETELMHTEANCPQMN